MMNSSRMEKRIRDVLRLVNQQCVTEDRLQDALTRIDEIVAHETGRGNEISPARLSGARTAAIQRKEWQYSLDKEEYIPTF